MPGYFPGFYKNNLNGSWGLHAENESVSMGIRTFAYFLNYFSRDEDQFYFSAAHFTYTNPLFSFSACRGVILLVSPFGQFPTVEKGPQTTFDYPDLCNGGSFD